MNKTTLTSFSNELKKTWQLFQGQWTTAISLSLVPIIPFLLTVPYLVEYAYTYQLYPTQNIPLGFTSILAIIGIIAFVITAQIVKAGLYILFSRGKGFSARKAFKEGYDRLIPFIYTNILTILAITILLVPSIVLYTWYGNSIRSGLDMGQDGMITIDLFVLIILTILILPAIFFAISLTFAPILVATKAIKGGIPALKASNALVKKRFFPVFYRLLGWGVLYVILTHITSPLPIANWLTPFILTTIGTAFLITMYKELKE